MAAPTDRPDGRSTVFAAQGLKLSAQDEEDIAVLSACLQDGELRVGDMAFLPRERLFAMTIMRFVWEAADPRAKQRVLAGLHFKGVMAARTLNLDLAERERMLELLAITAECGEAGAGRLRFTFAGGAHVELEVECIDAHLADLTDAWTGLRRPEHPIEN